jgi:hypothetical protein
MFQQNRSQYIKDNVFKFPIKIQPKFPAFNQIKNNNIPFPQIPTTLTKMWSDKCIIRRGKKNEIISRFISMFFVKNFGYGKRCC